jgi:hypothetical protein
VGALSLKHRATTIILASTTDIVVGTDERLGRFTIYRVLRMSKTAFRDPLD